MWTSEYDLKTLRVDANFFENGEKNLRFQKYPDTFGLGLYLVSFNFGEQNKASKIHNYADAKQSALEIGTSLFVSFFVQLFNSKKYIVWVCFCLYSHVATVNTVMFG